MSRSLGMPARVTPDVTRPEWGRRCMEDAYEIIKQVGEGMYGYVYKARELATGQLVALKKVKMEAEKEGFPQTALREIKLLRRLNHKNVVHLKEVVTSRASETTSRSRMVERPVYMVFEYLENDLSGLMRDFSNANGKREFTEVQIKYYAYQLFEGLSYCHRHGVLHRDLKASNLLLSSSGSLKIGDFGLARKQRRQNETAQGGAPEYTNNVVTLWYRCPELLLGTRNYDASVDMWSTGCILAELLLGEPILPGRNEIEQLERIWDLCGHPTPTNWPKHADLPDWHKTGISRKRPNELKKSQMRVRFKNLSKEAQDILERLLCLDPTKRMKADEALDSAFFWTEDFMGGKNFNPSTMPRYEECHELDCKMKRHQMKQEAAERERLRAVAANLPGASNEQQQQHRSQQQEKPKVPGSASDAQSPSSINPISAPATAQLDQDYSASPPPSPKRGD
jgi:cyclin-dependent kinase 12/13